MKTERLEITQKFWERRRKRGTRESVLCAFCVQWWCQ